MTDAEQEIVRKLSRCTMLPGTPEKRFVRELAAKANYDPDYTLTDRQREWLFRLGHRYRRQLGACMDPECVVEDCDG